VNVGGDFRLGRWGECQGPVLPTTEICGNGLDEDCNGTDLSCLPTGCEPGTTDSCYPGPKYTAGVGICVEGTQTCLAGAGWSECEGAVIPADEVCGNDIDEDCDGSDLPCP
jgi:hypothetical protein